MRGRVLLIGRDQDARIGRALHEAGLDLVRMATPYEGQFFLAGNVVGAVVLDCAGPEDDARSFVRELGDRLSMAPTVALVAAEAAVGDSVEIPGVALIAKNEGSWITTLLDTVTRSLAVEQPARRCIVRPTFVGRESEVQALTDDLNRAIAGDGRLALIVGEEGIGKTSVALEMSRRAKQSDVTVLWAHCEAVSGAPAYWPWMQILRQYVRTLAPAALREELSDSGAAVGWILPTLREDCPDLPTADDASLTRFHIVDGVTQFLKRAAIRRPLMLVLDDLHSADGDSLYLFDRLVRQCADAPLLVLGAYRESDISPSQVEEFAHLAQLPLATLLPLIGFGVSEVKRYVEQATTIRPSEAMARAIHARTEGHPLFVSEVTRVLALSGNLSDDVDEASLRVAIPENRRQAIASRLNRLSTGTQRVLDAAAVIGSEFGADLLISAVEGASDLTRAALSEALTAQLIVPSGDEPDVYRFAHVIVREVLYQRIAATARAALHARVAEIIISLTPEGTETEQSVVAIAHHALRAASDIVSLQRAVEWIVRAGDQAAALMAHEEAARQYALAVRTAERAGLARSAVVTQLLVKLAETKWRAGDMEAARSSGRRALTLARAAGEPAMVAAAVLAFAGRLPGFGAVVSDEEVVSELEQALALLPSNEAGLRARVMARLAEELACSPGRGAQRARAQQAIELARGVGDPAVLAAVLRTTQWAIWTPDAVERRGELGAEIVALASDTNDRVLALDGQLLRLWSALEHGDAESAWRQLDICTRLARELRLPQYAWVTTAARACLSLATARLDDAARFAREAFATGEQAGNPTMTLFAGAGRAYAKARHGRYDEVAAWLHEALTTVPLLASTIECVLVHFYVRTGQRERAQAQLTSFAADNFARVPTNATWLLNMTFLAAACVRIGDAPIARQIYAQLAPFTPYNVVLPPIFVQGPVAHHMGGLAAVMGNETAAYRHYEDALALEQRTGLHQWMAATQLAYGRLLLRSGTMENAERGAAMLASGRAVAQQLQLEHIVRGVDATPVPRVAVSEGGIFCRVGDVWQIGLGGQRTTLPHRVGMTYIRYLLERPGDSIPALELASLGGDSMLIDNGGSARVDRKAMMDVYRRLTELDALIVGCERRGSVVNAELLHERKQCAAYLKGRGAELVTAADRARCGITKAIARALKNMRCAHDGLAHHLERHIETGRLCTYVPDPHHPVRFDFSEHDDLAIKQGNLSSPHVGG